uniref:TetB n=1 Tax=Corynebacterium striatum TaxID=43770 RepID=Q9Z4Q2_CORST|nr:tetracycline efflux ABC transporter TetAB subunit B [Corynebacterium striatum]AAC95480.1 ABC transporter TetB [Corynebacterium striatum]AAG03361.1 TetB [Corynebacterium striatum]
MAPDYARTDAVAPASVKETFAYLSALPNALDRRWWAGLLLIQALIVAVYTTQSNLFGRSVDPLTGGEVPLLGTGTRAFVWTVGLALACMLVEMFLRALGNYVVGLKVARASIDLRRRCLDAILRAPVPRVMELGTGNVITRMTKDIDDVVQTITAIGSRVLTTVFVFPITFIGLLLIDVRFALILLLICICTYPFARAVVRAIPDASNAVSVAEARRNAVLLDTVRGLPTLRAFDLERWALARMRRTSWGAVEAEMDRVHWFIRLTGIGQVAFAAWVLLTLGVGAWLASAGVVTRAAQRAGRPLCHARGGTTTALVGTSGAGKSTLAALIAGLVEPTAGSIRVGAVETSQVSDTWTAKNVTLLTQDVHLFAGTLREDLSMAAQDATDADLLRALASVGLDPEGTQFARLFPKGLDTAVGAGAEDIPPEVEQQLALARVALSGPKVLILDEATAEAGSDATNALEDAAARITADTTALVVAHRLDQAAAADRILVMDAGRIIEDGTHTELVAADGRYAQLFAAWSGGGH